MSEIIGKAFENDEDKWMDRYKEVMGMLDSLTSIGVTIDANILKEMSPVEKDVHLDTVAMQILKHEWEQHAR